MTPDQRASHEQVAQLREVSNILVAQQMLDKLLTEESNPEVRPGDLFTYSGIFTALV